MNSATVTPVKRMIPPPSRNWTPVALVAAFIFFAALPAMKPPAFVESILYLLFFWIALATSWAILSGFTGYVSFGHGAFYGAGVYTLANLASYFSIWWCLIFSGLVAAALGVAVAAVVFRTRLRGELFALLTLALAIVLATIILNTPIDGGPGVYLLGIPLPSFYGSQASTLYLMGMGIGMLSLATAWFVQYSRLGRGLFAISDDEDVAEIMGVPTYAYKLIACGISSALAGVAGGIHALFVSYVTVGETFAFTVPLFVLLMSVLGGARSWIGPAIGAVFVTLLNNTFVSGDSALLARIGIGLTLILATLYLPEGIAGLAQKLWRGKIKDIPVDDPESSGLQGHAQFSSAAQAIPAPGGETLVQLEDVSLSFKGVRALDGVNMEVRKGEILGLVGPNGSGKSTLINVMTGFYKPDAGSIHFGTANMAGKPGHIIARRGIARTFQIPRPFVRMSVLENVTIAAMFGADNLPQNQARERAMHFLGFVGLDSRAHSLPSALNLHQRKFLELARALASGARLVMLDEVLAGLTPSEITSAIAMVRRIHSADTTIVFVEHNMRAVMELTHRLVVINQGRIIAEGDPREVMKNPGVIAAYLGTADAED